MTILKASTRKCLTHFGQSRFSGDHKQGLIKFTGASPSTVRKWFYYNKSGISPRGEYEIRARYYLEHLGYEIAELKKLPQPVRDVGGMCAFKVLSLDDVIFEFGLTGSLEDNRTQALAALRGARGVSAARMRALKVLAERNSERFLEARMSVPKLEYFGTAQSAKEKSSASVSRQPVARKRVPAIPEISVESLASLFKEILPLARTLVKHGSQEQRSRMRELAGKGTVFEVSNLANSLCSETAHQRNSGRQ
jgi:hypothetical protein